MCSVYWWPHFLKRIGRSFMIACRTPSRQIKWHPGRIDAHHSICSTSKPSKRRCSTKAMFCCWPSPNPFYIIPVLDKSLPCPREWSIAASFQNTFNFKWTISCSYITEKLKPHVLEEQQLIYVCHLFGPFMLRLDQERPRVGYDITTTLYEMLEQVDKNRGEAPLEYMDSICDLL